MVVESLTQRPERILDIEEIGDEAARRIDRAFKPQFDAIGMTVQPVATVLLADIRQPVRRLEMKRLRDFHGIPISLWVWMLRRQRGWARQ